MNSFLFRVEKQNMDMDTVTENGHIPTIKNEISIKQQNLREQGRCLV
jgi:hypothetical protein